MAAYREESDPRETFPASRFSVNTLFCPGCRSALQVAPEVCPECGYSGVNAVKKFPYTAPRLERFVDPNNHLRAEDCEKVDEVLNELGKEYPQVRFCFCVVELAESTDPREFGFWLLNASPVRNAVEERLRPWTVLVLIDHAHCRVSVTPGYAIEPFLSEERWRVLLRLEERRYLAGDYGTAILHFARGAAKVLGDAEKRVRRELSGRSSRWKGKGAGW